MKISLLKDGYREIKYSFKRFLSILLMSFLGVGFFAGIRSTSYDMKATLDRFYKSANVYDIKVVSTLGLTNEDVKKLEEIDGVKQVVGSFSKDVLLKLDETSYAAKVMSYEPEINKPMLSRAVEDSGLLPESSDSLAWCLVDKTLIERTDKKIGDYLELIETKGEDDKVLKRNRFQIIAVVDSPLYMSEDRGNSSLGSGKTDFFIYIPKAVIDSDYHTELYIKTKYADKYETDSPAYVKTVKKIEDDITAIKSKREKERYNKLKTEGEEKIQEAQDELNKETLKAKKKISDAENEISGAETKIKKADKDIADSKKKIEDAKADLKKEKAKAYAKLDDAKIKLNDGKTKITDSLEELNTKENELLKKKEELEQGFEQLNSSIEQLKAMGMDENTIEAQTEDKRQELQIAKAEIKKGLEEIEEGRKKLAEELNKIEEEEKKLPEKKAKIDKKIEDGNKKILDYQKEIEDGEKELKDSKSELKAAKKKLAEKEKEFIEKTSDAQEKLDDARDELNDLKYPKWHIFDRKDNTGYDGLIRDIKSVAKLGGLFPLILFLIAALISLNSMTRMVEEQRVELGTLKALGYSTFSIAKKYLRYAALASILGGFLGMSLGFRLIPKIIWGMYEISYSIPNELTLLFDWRNGGLGLIISSVCVLLATFAALLKELIEVPSQLMRPKAPKMGKRVLLERLNFIWKRLNFSQKVTLRNIFRYKKRFLMTIIGVIGCTALIVSGFGLRDSVSYLVSGQYGNIFDFDMMVRVSDNANSRIRKTLKENIKSFDSTEYLASVHMSSMKLTGKNDKAYDVQTIVTDDKEELRNVIHTKDKYSHSELSLEDEKIYITDKLAELTGVKAGDKISLVDENDKEVSFMVAEVLENYLSNYVYMTKSVYEKNFQAYKLNTFIIKNHKRFSETEVSSKILELDNVDAVILSSSIIDRMSVMMQSLNYVVAVLIIAAALLAFIVLFNLANLNISERKREIATIKVLGFYDKEVYDYLDRETIILTVIGIALGLPGGHYLNALIVKTCEVDFVRFNINLSVLSFVLSGVIALIFAFLVNIITYFSLKKVNMIESLKSVE